MFVLRIWTNLSLFIGVKIISHDRSFTSDSNSPIIQLYLASEAICQLKQDFG